MNQKCSSIYLFFFTFLASFANSQYTEYYETLGVSRTATSKQIRKAFKKLALELHPDKSTAPDAEAKFAKVNDIYETLKDEELRKIYDRYKQFSKIK